AQGVAVSDLAAGVRLEVAPEAVTLRLEDAAGRFAGDELLDLRGLADQAGHMVDRINELAREGEVDALTKAHLDLARALFAQDLAVEAWGQVQRAATNSPDTLARPEVRGLAGAILTRLGRLAEARTYLDDPLLGGAWVDFWRIALAAERGEYLQAAVRYHDVTAPWNELGDDLRAWLGVELGRALALGGEPSTAQAVLVIGVGERPAGAARDRALLVAGYIRDALGDRDGAARVWRQIALSRDRLVSVDARFALVEAGLEAGGLTTTEAIEGLESLSFAWRGGDREWRRLKRLVDLYLVNRQHRDALAAMRALVVHVPEAPDTVMTTRRMAEVFKDVMIGPASDYVTPLASLSIFNEFPELTPTGEEGDAMIALLSERLADVDLVAQAGDLLERQLKHRLTGDDRSRIGGRLAELRIAAGDAQAALAALAATGDAAMPDDLRHRRSMAQARALADLGRTGEAIAALGDDQADDAVWFRATTQWRAAAWAAACEAMEILLARPAVTDGPWGSRADLALRLALGYASAGDAAAARSLGPRFGALFADDPRRDMFAFLTSHEAPLPTAWNELPAAIADIADFEAFLAAYRGSANRAGAAQPAAPAQDIGTTGG
ncbi:MAG: hypothetical protein ACREER_08330, partial [Alphaproteobacteria bacterium]